MLMVSSTVRLGRIADVSCPKPRYPTAWLSLGGRLALHQFEIRRP
jgi:hypothetical protein